MPKDAIERIKQPVLRGHIRGARAVLEMLLCAPLSGDICRRRSFLSFDHAYEIFLSINPVPEYSHNAEMRRHFREFICSEKYGLCVYIYKDQILLRSDDVDLDGFLSFLHHNQSGSSNDEICASDLIQNFDKVLETVETEWDRKIVKVITGLFCSATQLEDIPGIRGDKLKRSTQQVLDVIKLTEDLKAEAIADVNKKLVLCAVN